MKIELWSLESAKSEWLSALQAEYKTKVNRFVPFEIVRLKVSHSTRSEKNRKIKEESETILNRLKSDDLLLVFDEHGFKLDTKKFTKKLIHFIETHPGRLILLIGGAYGLGDEVKKMAREQWCLSDLTLNHLLAQSVLLEQVYRAITIWKGIPYHNE